MRKFKNFLEAKSDFEFFNDEIDYAISEYQFGIALNKLKNTKKFLKQNEFSIILNEAFWRCVQQARVGENIPQDLLTFFYKNGIDEKHAFLYIIESENLHFIKFTENYFNRKITTSEIDSEVYKDKNLTILDKEDLVDFLIAEREWLPKLGDEKIKISKKSQEFLLKNNPNYINNIENLDPELEKKFSYTKLISKFI